MIQGVPLPDCVISTVFSFLHVWECKSKAMATQHLSSHIIKRVEDYHNNVRKALQGADIETMGTEGSWCPSKAELEEWKATHRHHQLEAKKWMGVGGARELYRKHKRMEELASRVLRHAGVDSRR